MNTAARMMWDAAGSPDVESQCLAGPLCWWCGCDTGGLGRPVKTLSSSMIATLTREPAMPESAHLCRPCGWSLSDWVGMPESVWSPALQSKLDGDGRVSMKLGDDRGQKVLICRGGRGVLVWDRPKQGAAGRKVEAAWSAMREEMATTGARFDGLALLADMPESEAGALLINKFRNYDHAAISGQWHAFKVARPEDRSMVRGWCASPPRAEWCLTLGDGQKHGAIYTPVSDGRSSVQCAYFEGVGEVRWVPSELSTLLDAMEALIFAGAHPEEVMSGDYRPRPTMELFRARREHDATVDQWRGSPMILLADRLRDSTAVIRDRTTDDSAQLVEQEEPDGDIPTAAPRSDDSPAPPVRLAEDPRPPDRESPRWVPGQQLRLFG